MRHALPLAVLCLLASCASPGRHAPTLRGLSFRDKTALVADADPSVRLLAIQSLASDARKAAPPVRAGIQQLFTDRLAIEPAPQLRRALVAGLSSFAGADALPAYVRALDDQSPIVRFEAIDALRRVSDPVALDLLLACLRNDPDDRVRAEALTAYASLAAPDQSEPVLQGLLRDSSDAVAIRARSELSRLKKKTPRPPGPAKP